MLNEFINQEIDLIHLKIEEWRAKMRGLPADCSNLIDEVIQSFTHLLDEVVAANKDLERINSDLIQSQWMADLEHRRYREMFENAPLGYLILDLAGKIKACNATAIRLLQTPAEVLVGQSLVEMIAEEDQRKLRSFFRHPGPEGVAQEVALHLKQGYPAGEQAILQVSRSLESPQRASEIWVSILQHPQGLSADQQFLLNEDQFRAFANTISEWLWEIDLRGVYWFASPKIKDILGCEPDEMIGKSLLDFRPADEADRLAAILRTQTESASPMMHFENFRIHKNGAVVYLETNSVPVFDQNGALVGFRGTDREITERKTLEENLRDSRKKTADLLESLSDASMEIDRNWRFTYVSRQASVIMDLPPHSILGKTVWELFPQILGTDQEATYRQVMDLRQSTHFEMEWPGNRRWYDIRIYPAKEGVTVYWVDITERKRMEKELRDCEKHYRLTRDQTGVNRSAG